MSMYIPWIIGVILAIVIVILSNSGTRKEEEVTEKPQINHYDTYEKYLKAERKWKEWRAKEIAKLPLVDRLRERNTSRHEDKVSHSDTICFICGKSQPYMAPCCPDCQKLYQRSSQIELPTGITEADRFRFWEFQQAITVDLMKGLIDEATARREMDEVPGEIMRLNRKAQERKEQIRREKEEHERELDERIDIMKRLSRK